VAGSAVRLLSSDETLVPEPLSRNLTVPDPTGLRTASQYLVPVVITVAGIAALFHFAELGAVIAPVASKLPGRPLASEYRPSTIFDGAEPEFTYTQSVDAVPVMDDV
jgi:hypothetical protein